MRKSKKFLLTTLYAVAISLSSCKSVPLSPKSFKEESKNDNFTIIPCNYQTNKEELIKLICSYQSQNIHCGLLFSSLAKEKGECYLEVEYIKDILKNCSLEYPIYLNVDSQPYVELNLIFLEKLEQNNCYVGVYSNYPLSFLNEEYSSYDKILPSGENTNLEITPDGSIIANTDLAKVIQKNDLNNPKNFIDDYVYIVERGDTLSDIANEFSIAVTDLKTFNHLTNEHVIQIGDRIVIPNYQISKENKDMLKGIDVSSFQGNIEWQVVAPQIDFAILKVCDFTNKDKNGKVKLDANFISNINHCDKLQIPFGVYAYSRAKNEEEARKEAEFVIEMIKDYDLKYPVYLDIESSYHQSLLKTKDGRKKIERIIKSWCDTIENNGYFVGVYSQKSMIDEFVKMGLNQKYNFWVARYGKNEQVTFKNAKPVESLNDLTMMTQSTDKGLIDGINGYVDINFCHPELTELVQKVNNPDTQLLQKILN